MAKKKFFTETSLGTLIDEIKAYVESKVSTKANSSHTHSISNVTNLQSTLDGKAASSHNHAASNITSGTLSSDRLPTVPISKGGTGATTAASALTNLGLTATAAELNYVDGVTSNIQTQLNNKAASNHTHNYAGSSSAGGAATSANKLATARTIGLSGAVTGTATSFDGSGNITIPTTSVDPTKITSGTIASRVYYAHHPESGTGVLPFIYNDLGFLLSKGGAMSSYKTTSTDYTAKTLTNSGTINLSTNLFDGTPSYSNYTLSAKTDKVVIDLTLHQVFSYSNVFYIDFGATNWRAQDISLYVMHNSHDTVYKKVDSRTNVATQNCFFTASYSTKDSSGNTVQGFNRMRIILTNFNTTTPRIAQIGLINYGSKGSSETLISKGGGSVYGSIYPYANNSTTLGTSSNKWSNVYATTFTGNLSGKATSADSLTGVTATATELNYVDGVTSNIQTQLDSKAASSHNHAASNITSGTLAVDRLPTVTVAKGGTGATTAANARTNLSVYSKTEVDTALSGKVKKTTQTANILGTSKTTETVGENQLYFPNGGIFGGTAAAAGLVTRGICGVSQPSTGGACTKDALYLNYDGNNDNSYSRKVVLGAGSTGTDLGGGLYSYSAARGDAVKAWVESQGYSKINGTPIVTTAGDGASYTATVDGVTALTVGMEITIIPHVNSSSTQPTLNVNSLGAKAIRMPISYNNSATSVGSIAAWIVKNKPVTVQYDGSYWKTISMPRPSAQYLYGTVPVANGGTGQTTLKDSANALIHSLDVGTSDVLTDTDYFVSQFVGGNESDHNTYRKRPLSLLWNYIKGKTDSTYATTAQGTKADNAMPKSGGTFTGGVSAAASQAFSNSVLRNIYCENVSSSTMTTGAALPYGTICILYEV